MMASSALSTRTAPSRARKSWSNAASTSRATCWRHTLCERCRCAQEVMAATNVRRRDAKGVKEHGGVSATHWTQDRLLPGSWGEGGCGNRAIARTSVRAKGKNLAEEE